MPERLSPLATIAFFSTKLQHRSWHSSQADESRSSKAITANITNGGNESWSPRTMEAPPNGIMNLGRASRQLAIGTPSRKRLTTRRSPQMIKHRRDSHRTAQQR